MAVFSYKGRNARGDLVRGTLDGSDSCNARVITRKR